MDKLYRKLLLVSFLILLFSLVIHQRNWPLRKLILTLLYSLISSNLLKEEKEMSLRANFYRGRENLPSNTERACLDWTASIIPVAIKPAKKIKRAKKKKVTTPRASKKNGRDIRFRLVFSLEYVDLHRFVANPATLEREIRYSYPHWSQR